MLIGSLRQTSSLLATSVHSSRSVRDRLVLAEIGTFVRSTIHFSTVLWFGVARLLTPRRYCANAKGNPELGIIAGASRENLGVYSQPGSIISKSTISLISDNNMHGQTSAQSGEHLWRNLFAATIYLATPTHVLALLPTHVGFQCKCAQTT